MPAAVLGVLDAAEGAMRACDALGVPRPLPDGGLGGDASFDIYVDLEAGPGHAPPRLGQDAPALGERFDTTSAFALLSAGAGCVAASEVAYALGHAAAVRLDAGADEGTIAMAASYIASLAAPCPAAEIVAVDAFQRAPERAITGGALGALDGALLFPWFLDDAYGVGRPGHVLLALLAVAAQKTPPGALHFRNEPDIFDALRASLRFRKGSAEDVLLDFAVARAFVGNRSDGAHLSDVARFGDAGRVRFDWSIPYATLPRRVAPLRPVEPTGAAYLWLDLAGVTQRGPGGAAADEVTFVADWELPAVFRWALIKVDPQGAEVGRVDVAGIFGASHVERTVVGLQGLAGLLLVGVNAGSMIRSRPFDPDETPFTPHAYAVWLAK